MRGLKYKTKAFAKVPPSPYLPDFPTAGAPQREHHHRYRSLPRHEFSGVSLRLRGIDWPMDSAGGPLPVSGDRAVRFTLNQSLLFFLPPWVYLFPFLRDFCGRYADCFDSVLDGELIL